MKNTLQFKNFDLLETKADESGNLEITGYGAYFNNVDSYDEIIEKGAFVKALSERAGRIAFCYQHDIWNPIGKIEEIREDENGLWLKVKVSASEKSIQTKIKEGILKEMSIGYRVINSRSETRDGKEVVVLSEIKLIEVSLVTVAANPLAVVETMKGEEKKDFLRKEFDRVLSIVRNDNINFEIEMLKSLALELAPDSQKEEDALSKDDLVTALVGGKNEMLNVLNL